MKPQLLTNLRVKKILFFSKLAYAGKAWRDGRRFHAKAFGICAYIVQGTEIAALTGVILAIELLIISLL